MIKIFVLFMILFLSSCTDDITIYSLIRESYPDCQIIRLAGWDGDQYIIYTKNKEIRFINVDRVSKIFEVNQKINLIKR